MDTNFEACLAVILKSEGGFVDDPQDPGGATNLGVTLATLSSWRKSTQTIADVQALTSADVAPIYRAMYWNVTHCSQLPVGVDLMVFDEAVNQGPGHAVVDLQVSLGVTADGAFGPNTALAVNGCDPATVIDAIHDRRLARYQALPTWGRFGQGWTNRLAATEQSALAMIA